MKNILLAPIFAAVEGAANVPEGFLEKLWYGLQIAVIGICIVFAVLAMIMGVLYLFEYFFYTLPKKQKSAPASNAPVSVAKPVPVAAPVAVAASADDDEVAAVIAAAVAAYYEQVAPTSKYRIKSFRRI